MFFARVALFVLPAIAIASVIPRDDDEVNSCNINSSQYCCNSVQDASSFSASDKKFLGLFGGSLDNVIGQVGLACNPISAAGAGLGGAVAGSSAGCSQQNVCCQNTQANGFIAINCTPFIVNA